MTAKRLRIVTVIDGLKVFVEYQLPQDANKFMQAFRELEAAGVEYKVQVKS